MPLEGKSPAGLDPDGKEERRQGGTCAAGFPLVLQEGYDEPACLESGPPEGKSPAGLNPRRQGGTPASRPRAQVQSKRGGTARSVATTSDSVLEAGVPCGP
eukprot:CAMPEP_0196659830 /NCGR_PEP_ID=MMETSP1086-20130531/36789_1 /TAXON_ID=77921 /ORGANISM="Cyanoptyche  gloeocystis , Strain SAG4.97" /LENGTH=100 /DNA_ID=CAMNT_0041993959 /DNA_START=187 /DNA_END=486 /DNA_ORIENTATION=+